jgi:putative endonuclease
MHPHKWGLIAEYIIAFRYILKGYSIVKHRWKSRLGEIDLILKKGNLIVFCEVKARSSNFPLESFVSDNQKKRIIRSAESFLSKNKAYKNYSARFDLAVVRSIFTTSIYYNWLEK